MKYQINGKMEDDVKKLSGLKELVGLKAKNVFKASSIQELEENMSEMSLLDLQKMAVACGVSGGGNRTVLKTKIRNEFLKYTKGSLDGIYQEEKIKLSGKNKKSREQYIHELMTEGL